jgi:peptide/nickel transport system substrate-binding protein
MVLHDILVCTMALFAGDLRRGEAAMKRLLAFAACAGLLPGLVFADAALAQKQSGVLRVFHRDSPASMSILEEGSISAIMPMMGVFNNLVLFDQHVPQNRVESIVPDLATSWSSSEDGTELSFKLREGVQWHDGQPFTAADVKCTYDLLTGKAKEKLRLNYREAWFLNLNEVTTNGDTEVIFHLKRPQPSLISLLASGYSPIYPCHVSARDMRSHPIGTGPFKFVEYKPNQSIRVARNPDYWKPGRPYLDGIEYTIIANRSTAILAFVAGKFDMTFPYEVSIPLVKQVQNQAPQAICEVKPMNGRANLLVTNAPPFDNPVLRRAMQLSLDRKSFIDILGEGQYDIGAVLQPPPEGIWGMPREMLEQLTGYGPDVGKNREDARAMMRSLGYGPDNRLKVKLVSRNIAWYRDPAAILIDQLKEIWIDAELETVETANWVPKLMRKDFAVAMSLSGSAVDDPDTQFYENYSCGSSRNYTGCTPEVNALIDRQSAETDPAKRKELVWQIERKLIEDAVRPIIFFMRQGTCWQPEVKGLTLMENSIFNSWRMEDVWLDKN